MWARETRPRAMTVVVLTADRVRATLLRLARELRADALHVVHAEVPEGVAAVGARPGEGLRRIDVAEDFDTRHEREHLRARGHRDVVHLGELGMPLHQHAASDPVLPWDAVTELPQAALDEGVDVDVLDVILRRATRPHRHVRHAAGPHPVAVVGPRVEGELARGAP